MRTLIRGWSLCLLIVSACTLPNVSARKHDASSMRDAQLPDAAEMQSSDAGPRDASVAGSGGRGGAGSGGEAGTSAGQGGRVGAKGSAGMAPAAGSHADAAVELVNDDADSGEPMRVIDQNDLARWPMPDAFPGSQTPPSYETRGDTTIDLITHLEWQRSPPQVLEGCTFRYTDLSSSPDGDICTWQQAKDYCQRYGEQRNEPRWRMPTKIELESILDETRAAYTIDRDFFSGQEPYPYWTSTPYQGLEEDYYFVEFFVGTTQHGKGAYKAEVRCVR